MTDIWHRLFQREQPGGPGVRSEPRESVHIPVRALVGVELKQGHLVDVSSRGARIMLEGVRRAPEWVDLELPRGIQRGLVRWSKLREGERWEGGLEFEYAGR